MEAADKRAEQGMAPHNLGFGYHDQRRLIEEADKQQDRINA